LYTDWTRCTRPQDPVPIVRFNVKSENWNGRGFTAISSWVWKLKCFCSNWNGCGEMVREEEWCEVREEDVLIEGVILWL